MRLKPDLQISHHSAATLNFTVRNESSCSQKPVLLLVSPNRRLMSYRQTLELNMWHGWLSYLICAVCFLIQAAVSVVAVSPLCMSAEHEGTSRAGACKVELLLPLLFL